MCPYAIHTTNTSTQTNAFFLIQMRFFCMTTSNMKKYLLSCKFYVMVAWETVYTCKRVKLNIFGKYHGFNEHKKGFRGKLIVLMFLCEPMGSHI